MVPVRQVCKWCGKSYSCKERLKGQEITEGYCGVFNSSKKMEQNNFCSRPLKSDQIKKINAFYYVK